MCGHVRCHVCCHAAGNVVRPARCTLLHKAHSKLFARSGPSLVNAKRGYPDQKANLNPPNPGSAWPCARGRRRDEAIGRQWQGNGRGERPPPPPNSLRQNGRRSHCVRGCSSSSGPPPPRRPRVRPPVVGRALEALPTPNSKRMGTACRPRLVSPFPKRLSSVVCRLPRRRRRDSLSISRAGRPPLAPGRRMRTGSSHRLGLPCAALRGPALAESSVTYLPMAAGVARRSAAPNVSTAEGSVHPAHGGFAPRQGPQDSLQRRCCCHALFCQALRCAESSLPAVGQCSPRSLCTQARDISHHVPLPASTALLVPANQPSVVISDIASSFSLQSAYLSPQQKRTCYSPPALSLLLRFHCRSAPPRQGSGEPSCLSSRSHQPTASPAIYRTQSRC